MGTRGFSVNFSCIFVNVKFPRYYHLVYMTAEDVCVADLYNLSAGFMHLLFGYHNFDGLVYPDHEL